MRGLGAKKTVFGHCLPKAFGRLQVAVIKDETGDVRGQRIPANHNCSGLIPAIFRHRSLKLTLILRSNILRMTYCGTDRMGVHAEGVENSSPGLEGIEKCENLDIACACAYAGSVVEYIAAGVDFPDLDIRQRLTVSRGYGVSEVLVRGDLTLMAKRSLRPN